MTNNTALSTAEQNFHHLRGLARHETTLASFAEILGERDAPAYISSVLIAVQSNDALMGCSPRSILRSAMRAATLRLSCDPSVKQAYLVPFKSEATLVVGYKGLQDMAVRTGKYRYLNCFEIYEGEIVTEDRFKGIHSLSGGRTGDTIIGYMLSFELKSGFAKTFYMTVEQIKAHGAKYSKSYSDSRSLWQKDFHAMARKTVLRMGLSKWGYFDPYDRALLDEVDETIDVQSADITHPSLPAQTQMTPGQAMRDLGFDEPEPAPAPAAHNADPETGEVIEGEIEEPAAEKPWKSELVSLETARSAKSSDGTLYWDMPTDKLTPRFNALIKSLRDNGLTPEQKEDKQFRRDVIKAILDYRAQPALI